MPGKFGRLLMRDEYNSALYGPLQDVYEAGKTSGTDVWIHKNRQVFVFFDAVIFLILPCQDEWIVGVSVGSGFVSEGKRNQDPILRWC